MPSRRVPFQSRGGVYFSEPTQASRYLTFSNALGLIELAGIFGEAWPLAGECVLCLPGCDVVE